MQIHRSFGASQKYIYLLNGKLKGYICEEVRDAAIGKVCQDKNANLIYISPLSEKVL